MKNQNDTGGDKTSWLFKLLERFEPKSVRVMTVEEYEREFDTKFPDDNPSKEGHMSMSPDPWMKIATDILERDFDEEPIDLSTKKCFIMGLRRRGEPIVMDALTKLQSIRPVKWTKRDLVAGKLLPRRKRNQ